MVCMHDISVELCCILLIQLEVFVHCPFTNSLSLPDTEGTIVAWKQNIHGRTNLKCYMCLLQQGARPESLYLGVSDIQDEAVFRTLDDSLINGTNYPKWLTGQCIPPSYNKAYIHYTRSSSYIVVSVPLSRPRLKMNQAEMKITCEGSVY